MVTNTYVLTHSQYVLFNELKHMCMLVLLKYGGKSTKCSIDEIYSSFGGGLERPFIIFLHLLH